MDDGSIFMIVALIILIGLSAFFSAAETAYNSLNEIRLRSKAEDGDAKAAHTLALVERYDSLLSTILIGNNIVNIGASSLATVLFTRLVGGVYGPTVSTIVMTLLVLAFGEITPKSMAKEMPETLAMGFAPVLSALVTIFTPLNALFGAWKKFLAKRFDTGEKDTITEGELVTMVSEAEKDGELTNRESELIRSAIEFDDVEAQDVLTPRVDVVAVADDTPMDEVTERFAESGYSRLPVYHDTIDNIIGVVHEKDCFAALQKHDKNVKLEDLIGPTLYTTSVTQISALLRTLQGMHQQLLHCLGAGDREADSLVAAAVAARKTGKAVAMAQRDCAVQPCPAFHTSKLMPALLSGLCLPLLISASRSNIFPRFRNTCPCRPLCPGHHQPAQAARPAVGAAGGSGRGGRNLLQGYLHPSGQ